MDFFQLQQSGQLGNAGRNILHGPNTRVFDFSLQREFPIRENVGLEFRWEVFNLSNTTQFSPAGARLVVGFGGKHYFACQRSSGHAVRVTPKVLGNSSALEIPRTE